MPASYSMIFGDDGHLRTSVSMIDFLETGVFLGLPKHLRRRSLGVPDSENDLIMCPKIIFQVVHGKHCVVHRGSMCGPPVA